MLNVKIAAPTPFARAVAEFRAATAERRAFDENVHAPRLDEFKAACAAARHKSAPATEQRITEINELFGIDTLKAEEDRLISVQNAAIDAVQVAPVASLDEMTEKFSFLQKLDAIEEDVAEQIMADIQALLTVSVDPLALSHWQAAEAAIDQAEAAEEAFGSEYDEDEFGNAAGAVADAIAHFVSLRAPSSIHALHRLQRVLAEDGWEYDAVAKALPRMVDEALQLSTAQ